VRFFWLIFSIILYFISPNEYNFFICLIASLIFVLLAIRTLKNNYNKKNYLSFFIFFSISFFFVNFFYPIIIYPFDKDYFIVFSRFSFNEKIITKATVLALIAYCSFLYGLDPSKLKVSQKLVAPKILYLNLNNYILKSIFILALIFNFSLFFFAKDGISSRRSDAFFEIAPSLMVFCQVLVNMIIIMVFYLKKSYSFLILPFLYILTFLYVGDRGPALQSILVFLFAYHYFHKKIKIRILFFLIVIGFISLTIISSTRGRNGSKNIKEIQIVKYYDFAMDFIIVNRNLYAGYDYANKNGYAYGKSYLPYVFSPFPLMPSFVSNSLFNKEPRELSSGTILTKEANASWGLGTNLVSDIYMQFGLLGVILFMLNLGYLLRYLELNFSKSLYISMVYFFLISFSIYMPRSTLFDSFRYVSWALLLYFFIYAIFKPFHKLRDA